MTKTLKWDFLYSFKYDSIFFLFPVWLPALYFLLIRLFPAHDLAIFLISYCLLAETHFCSTWTVYLDPKNRDYFNLRPWIFYYVPLLIVAACVFLTLTLGLKLTMLISSAISAVHVTRQSVGMVGIYRSKAKQFDLSVKNRENNAVYLFGSSSWRVGKFRLISDRIEHARENLEAQMLFVS